MLVTCPECGAKISGEADPCPKCGCRDAGWRSDEYEKLKESWAMKEIERKREIEKYMQLLKEQIQKNENYFRWGKCKDYHQAGGCSFSHYKMLAVDPSIYDTIIGIRYKCANCGATSASSHLD